MESGIFILFYSVGLAIVGYDIKEHRVPNKLVFVGIADAFLLCLLDGGVISCARAFISMMVPFVLLFPVYVLGMIGAGDIKFLCMLSVLLNWGQTLYLIFYACVLGSIWSLVRMLRNKSLIRRFQYFKDYVISFSTQTGVKKYFSPEGGYEDTIAFALPIGISYILHLGGMY